MITTGRCGRRWAAGRRLRTLLAAAALVAGLLAPWAPAAALATGCANPVACENQLPGTSPAVWDIGGAGSSSLQGFATDTSVNVGGTISFKINSTTLGAYSIDIYRIGYYQGNGARLVTSISPSTPLPQKQPACLTSAPTGLMDCGNWAVSASWTVPATAVSGVYIARLAAPSGAASHIIFVVRNDASTSPVLFRTNDTTWQAYNDYGGNNLYYGSAPSSNGRAYKVSFNRPYNDRSEISGYGTSNFFFYAEYPMIRWLEANGYDLSYESELDPERSPGLLTHHRTILTAGHDEYWSGGQAAALQQARDAGVNLALFTGNDMFWKVRFESSIDGSVTPYRTLVCYKETLDEQQLDPQDPPTWTGTWRDPTFSPPSDGGRPENQLLGQIFMVNRGSASITVGSQFSRLRLWRNTPNVSRLTSGQSFSLGSQTIGYEWDEDLDNGYRPPGTLDESSTTVSVPELLQDYGSTYAAGTAVHSLTMYRAASGALVFDAGTVQWAWGLDVNHDTSPDTGPSSPSPDMQQAMVNLLADMGAQPTTLQAGLVAATASTDTTPPSSTVTAPAAGSTVNAGSTVTVSGTAADAGGGVVAGVEVSVDGGVTWHPASGTTSWSYAWHPARAGTATIRTRAVDDSGNLESPGPGVTVTIAGNTLPAFVSKSTVQQGTIVTAPAGIYPGDLLIASLQLAANPVSVTGPSGWTLLMDTPVALGTSSQFHAQVWYKVATSKEPGSYSWGVPAGVYTDVAVMDYMNVNSNNPVDASAGVDAGVTATASTPSVTTTLPGDLLIAYYEGAQYGSWTAGSGMTQRYNYDSITAQDARQATAGATGARTATNSTSSATSAQIVALRAATTDTQPPTVSVTAPAAGSTVGGNAVTLSASASDDVAVAGVQFSVDGAAVGGVIASPPYSTTWDTTRLPNGSHTITATATDTSGNSATSSPVVVTTSNIGPAISGVTTGSTTTTGTVVGWTTDQPSTSQVDYGPTAAYGSSTALDQTLVTSHSQALSGLSPGTTYHYRVRSQNSSGVLSVSPDATFTTLIPPPPVISNVQATGITASGATITWTTDTPSDTTVRYGTTTAYGSSASTAGLVTSHSQALGGLAATTLYHYQVLSKDAFGQVSASGDLTFTTTAIPPSPPSFRSSSTVTNGTSVPRPSGAAAGDLLLATLEIDADPVTVTAPSGWTLLLDTPAAQGTASAFHSQVWYRVATASEPSSYTWTVSGGPWVDIGLLDYANVSTTSPIDVSAGRDAGSTTTPTTAAVTTTAQDDMVVAIFVNYSFGTWTAGSGMTKRYDFDSNTAQDQVQAAAGSTGTKTATNSGAGPTTAQVVALRAR